MHFLSLVSLLWRHKMLLNAVDSGDSTEVIRCLEEEGADIDYQEAIIQNNYQALLLIG